MKTDGFGIGRSFLIASIIGLLAAGFILVNGGLKFVLPAFIYFIFIVSSYIIVDRWTDNFGSKSTLTGQIILGAIVGLLFIGLTFTGFSIGLPETEQSLSDTSNFIMKVVAAPFGEEIFFRVLIFAGLALVLPIGLAMLIQALGFSAYHATAYGAFDIQSGAFIAAAFFGLVMSYVIALRIINKRGLFTKLKLQDLADFKLISVIVVHLMVNLFLATRTFVVVG